MTPLRIPIFLPSLFLLLELTRLQAENFTIGYLTNIHGRGNSARQGYIISGAIGYAVEKINRNQTKFLSGHRLNLIYNDTQGERLKGTKAVIDQWAAGAIAYFGPEDSCDVEATVATSLNLPMISYKCTDSKVSKKEEYTSFARTQPPDKRIVRSVISLMSYYRWLKFSIICERNPQFQTVAESLETEAIKEGNFSINSKITFDGEFHCCVEKKDCCGKGFIKIIEDTYRITRVYVFIGSAVELINMMVDLHLKGLLDSGDYIVIYIDLETYTESQSYKYFWNVVLQKDRAQSALEAARSLLVVVLSPPHAPDYSYFEGKVREYNQKPPFNFPDSFDQTKFKNVKKHITIFGSYLYDAVMLYAEALDEVLKKGEDPRNGTDIIRRIIARKRYQSVTGAWMQIDENGDTEGNYTVLSLLPIPANLSVKGYNGTIHTHTMLPVGSFFYDHYPSLPAFREHGKIVWVGGHPPWEEPPCGFDGSLCKAPPDKNREISASILASLLLVVSLVSAITYRNWKYEQEIAGLLWKINIRDIQRGHPDGIMGYASKMSLASQMTTESRAFTPAFTHTATYKGTWVAIKHLNFSRKLADIPRETKKEMKLMREIHNDNINPFIGACVENTGIIIITEYCAKGSLQDILENSDIKLDNMFVASLVFDLIKAMTFLHESDLKIHGNLKSTNCLVTSRWILQVADFGVHELRATSARDTLTDDQLYRNLLWKAPELLRNSSSKVSQKGDVYAFAIILHEIIARQGTFGNLDMSPQEIVSRLKEVPSGEPFRPSLAGLECQDFVLQTMKDCWAEKPEARPDFRHIRQRLNRMRKGMKSNIMDNMMAMMEKYADNLEELVNERTAQLVEEQKKTEALLHRMLPKSVAQELMRGEPVIPEAFDAVTIYFSDIVGFTEMSANSTPMEVVTFLNDLYTVFDDVISHYDVYKVETIGDAYMVVSGLPIRNGDRHASEIASMALELLDSIRSFRIRHRPQQTLKLRIGLHTGPVVAGVVGLTMPRYCLFGDTVNTASRMESNGEALRIHVSPDCQMYLQRLGGYILAERGLVKMKGKGELLTYWLEGLEEGPVHRSDIKDLVYPQPLFPPASAMLGRRSPKLSVGEVLPRRSSLAVRHETGGLWAASLASSGFEDGSMPIHGVPTFLRLQQQQENSPRSSPQNLRDARLSRLREASDKERNSASCGDIPINPNKVIVSVNNGFSPTEEQEPKQNGFIIGGDELRPLLNIRSNHLIPVQEELVDKSLLSAPSLLEGSSSKRWKSCDAIALPKGHQGIKGLISGIFTGHHNRKIELDHRRGSNPTVGHYKPKLDQKLSGESAV